MKYFAIGVQRGNLDVPEIIDCNEIIRLYHRKPGNSYLLPDWNILKVSSNPNTLFVDYLSYPVPLFSESLQEIVTIYEPGLSYRKFVLYNIQQNHSALYFHPLLPVITVQRNLLNRSMILKEASGISLFMAGERMEYKIYMRLDLMESIFRREIVGITVEELELDGKPEEKEV